MSEYQTLRNNPPTLKVKEDAREVIFYTTSCMCDNKHSISFKREANSDRFSVSGGRFSLSNWQMKGDYKTDLLWAADAFDWAGVARIINDSVEAISSVRSR